jgi:hypothetical protein
MEFVVPSVFVLGRLHMHGVELVLPGNISELRGQALVVRSEIDLRTTVNLASMKQSDACLDLNIEISHLEVTVRDAAAQEHSVIGPAKIGVRLSLAVDSEYITGDGYNRRLKLNSVSSRAEVVLHDAEARLSAASAHAAAQVVRQVHVQTIKKSKSERPPNPSLTTRDKKSEPISSSKDPPPDLFIKTFGRSSNDSARWSKTATKRALGRRPEARIPTEWEPWLALCTSDLSVRAVVVVRILGTLDVGGLSKCPTDLHQMRLSLEAAAKHSRSEKNVPGVDIGMAKAVVNVEVQAGVHNGLVLDSIVQPWKVMAATTIPLRMLRSDVIEDDDEELTVRIKSSELEVNRSVLRATPMC